MSNSVFIIAEAGVNHNGQKDLAFSLIDAAAEAGADAVKFQTFTAEGLVTPKAGMAAYQKRNLGKSGSQLEMLKKLELSREDHFALAEHCKKCGVAFMSSPFDMDSLAFLLDEMKLPIIKVPSGELTNGPYLFALGQSGRKCIISTGMAVMGEITEALDLIAWGYLRRSVPRTISQVRGTSATTEGKATLAENLVLLHCTTEYPAAFDSINLRAMKTLMDNFGLPVGLSDHSEGIAVPIAAAALGATIVEKHLTLDRTLPGPDHKASLSPAELRQMVAGIRAVEQALGQADKVPSAIELENAKIARKSIVAAKIISAGDIIGPKDVDIKRPAGGISPMYYWDIIGQTAQHPYEPGDLIV